MSVTHSNSARNDLCDAIVALIDGGAGDGYVELLTSLSAECATLVLSSGVGVVSSGILTFDPVTNDSSATGGVVTNFRIRASTGVDVVFGSVALSGGDLTISNTTIGVGDTVSLSSFTYTAPL